MVIRMTSGLGWFTMVRDPICPMDMASKQFGLQKGRWTSRPKWVCWFLGALPGARGFYWMSSCTAQKGLKFGNGTIELQLDLDSNDLRHLVMPWRHDSLRWWIWDIFRAYAVNMSTNGVNPSLFWMHRHICSTKISRRSFNFSTSTKITRALAFLALISKARKGVMWFWPEKIEISFEFSLHLWEPLESVMLGLFSLGFWKLSRISMESSFDLPGAQCRRHTRNPEKPRTAKLDLGRKKLRFLHRFWCFWDEQQLTHDMAMDDPLQGMPAPIHWLFAVKKSQVTNEELANKADLGSWFGASISKHPDRMTMRGDNECFLGCFLPTQFELCSPPGVMI